VTTGGCEVALRWFAGRLPRSWTRSEHRRRDLRYTYATTLLRAGVHSKVVAERLGHASIGITLDIYSHVLPSMQEEEAERIDAGLRRALARGRGDAQPRMFRWTIGKKHPWPLTPRAKQETSDSGVRVEIDETIWQRSSECCMIGRRRTARLCAVRLRPTGGSHVH